MVCQSKKIKFDKFVPPPATKNLIFIIAISISLLILYCIKTEHLKINSTGKLHPYKTVVTVVCGMKSDEVLTMIKSLLIFNRQNESTKVILITEAKFVSIYATKLYQLRNTTVKPILFEIKTLRFPAPSATIWKNLFKPCAAQRLFLPTLLDKEELILYLDTDTIFLSPLSEIWSHFKCFNSSQLAALVPEHEDKNIGWYNRFARHPYYGPFGVNSGVMLMNLSKMRDFNWEDRISSYYTSYKQHITWGDQDLINILFHFDPDKLYILPCEYNYRPDHCMYLNLCNASDGIRILHGNRGYFHLDKQPVFKVIYDSINAQTIHENSMDILFQRLKDSLIKSRVSKSNCGKVVKQLLIRTN